MVKSEEKKEGHYIRKERYEGACQRSFYVGPDVTEEDIKAEFKHGILKLFVPKKELKMPWNRKNTLPLKWMISFDLSEKKEPYRQVVAGTGSFLLFTDFFFIF